MAYKYSIGGRKFDDITAETDAQGNTKIDFEEDYIGLVTSGSSTLVVSGSMVGIGTTSPDYTLDVAGDIGVDQYIYHNGDADTLIRFTDDKIVLKAGNKAMVTMEEKSSSPHEVTINDGSNNIDFVVKGNGSGEGNPGMKFDASTNKLGINGVGTPDEALHVDGNIKVVGNDPRIKIDGDTNSHPGLELYENGTRKWIVFNDYTNDNLTFKTNSNIRMSIEQDGNVGIGIENPNHALTVVGDISASIHISASSFYGDGSNLTGISSPGGANALSFNDDVKLVLGSGPDLEIYHSGHENYIKDAGNSGSGAGTIIIDGSNGVKLREGGSDILHADTNLKSYADFYIFNSKNLVMQGAGSTLSTDGSIGVGTSTPNRDLEVYKDAAQASIGIIANTTGQSSLWLGNTGDNNVGGIYYEHDNNALEFRVNDDQHLSLTNTRLKLKHIDLQIQTDGNTPTLEFQGAGSNKLGEINSDAINGTTSQMRFYIEESGSLVQKLTIKTDGIHDSKGPLRNVPTSPLSGTHAGGYVMLVSDSGKCVAMSGDVTLQSAGQGGPFGGGDVITILNASASAITLNQGSGLTLYDSGTGNTGNRTLGARGMATVIYMYGGNTAYISGAQLT